MASQVFYRKWRPQTLADVVGQEHVTRTLLNALKNQRVSHAYLFCGPRGTGKTSTGRILAKAVNCLTNKGKGEPCNTCAMCQAITEGRAMDVIEVDAASNTGVDDIRSLREKTNYAPSEAACKVYIIDEVHMLSSSAANALLKTLEEPPPQVIFVLATTEAHKVLPTTMSRCQRFDFRRLSLADTIAKLESVAEAEGIKIEPEALRLVARSSGGSLRDAENLLEQLSTFYSREIQLQHAQEALGLTGDSRVKELAGQIVSGDISAGIRTLASVNADGLDLKRFSRELVTFLRQLLLVKTGAGETADLTADETREMKETAESVSLGQILAAVKSFGQLDNGTDFSSTLPLELALMDAATPEETPPAPEPKAATPPIINKATIPAAKPAEKPKAPAEKPAAVSESKPPKEEIKPIEKPVEKPVAHKAEAPKAKTEEEPPKAATKKEAAVEKPPQPAPKTAEGQKDNLSRLQQEWNNIIEKAPSKLKRTAALAILRSAGVTPVAINNSTVILSFKYPVHKEKIEELENKRVTAEVISGFLGQAYQVECICEPEENHLVREAQRRGAQIIKREEK